MHSPSESGRASESGAALLVSAARRRAVASNAAMKKQRFSINVGEFSRLQPVRSTILRGLLHGGARLGYFGGHSQGQIGARNLFRSSRPLSTIWRNAFRAPKKI